MRGAPPAQRRRLVTACAVGAALLGPPGLFVCEQVCARRFVQARLGVPLRWEPRRPLPVWAIPARAQPADGGTSSVYVTMDRGRISYAFSGSDQVFAAKSATSSSLRLDHAAAHAARIATACLAPPPATVIVESLQTQAPCVSMASTRRDAFRAVLRIEHPSRYVYRRYGLRMDEHGRPLLLWPLDGDYAGAQR